MILETLTLAKKTMPLLEPVPMAIFNVEEKDFLDRTEKIIGTDSNWEAHVAQQIPLPRTNSPSPTHKQPGSLEQLETFTEDDMDIRDFSERSTNNMRPPKPPRNTEACIQDLILPPRCPDYIVKNNAVMGIPKPPLAEFRSLLIEKTLPFQMSCLPEEITSQDNI